jgi:hypothetical protein
MAELEKRIIGDWVELREKSNELHALLDALALHPPEIRETGERLRHSVEQGIVEFKRTLLSPVLVALETARYKSLATGEMGAQEKSLTQLILVILVQRLLAAEMIPLSRQQEQKRDFGIGDLQVNVILSDINARVKANPKLRAHAAVKNILMQVSVYNKENQKMRELLPTIKPEMRASFLSNFTKTFEEIIGSIRRHYSVILQEEAEAQKAREEVFSLSLFPLKELAPLLVNQAKEIARMRSTLAHARDEKYKTREVLVRLYDQRHEVLKMIEEEVKTYRKVCQQTLQYDLDGCVHQIVNAFRDEVVGILEKQGKKETTG